MTMDSVGNLAILASLVKRVVKEWLDSQGTPDLLEPRDNLVLVEEEDEEEGLESLAHQEISVTAENQDHRDNRESAERKASQDLSDPRERGDLPGPRACRENRVWLDPRACKDRAVPLDHRV